MSIYDDIVLFSFIFHDVVRLCAGVELVLLNST